MPRKLLWSVERIFLDRAVEMRVRGLFVIILSVFLSFFFFFFDCSYTAFYRQTQLGWFVVPGGEAATTWSVFPTYLMLGGSLRQCLYYFTPGLDRFFFFFCRLKCV